MISWIFLDVGNILLNEDLLAYQNFRNHFDSIRTVRPDLTFSRLLNEREECALSGSSWPLFEVASRYLDEAGVEAAWQDSSQQIRHHYESLSLPIDGAEKLLVGLRDRFRLGLIANQGVECRRWLDKLGWLGWFDVLALSEEEGIFKPDPALFRRALDRAGVAPESSVMAGDRLDNDVAPARQLGMKTAWVRWPDRAAKGWVNLDPDQHAFVGSLDKHGHPATDVIPDLAVDNLRDLLPALLRLDLDQPI